MSSQLTSASVRSIPFLSSIVPIFSWNLPLISLIFFEEISSLSHSIVSLYFSALISEEVFLIFPYYSLELCIQMGISVHFGSTYTQMGISFLFAFAFSFSSFLSYLWGLFRQPFCLFCISFSWGLSWSQPPVQCHKPPSIVFQALCLSDLIPWIYFSLPLYNQKGFDLDHTWIV